MSTAHANGPEHFGLMAEFGDPDELVEKTRKAYEAGYRHMDAYAPFPIHGLSEALGIRRNLVPYIVGLGALMGGIGGFMLQYWTSVISYPINIGGRPLNSWPAFMVITFETAVLTAGILGVVGMLALNKLPQPYHPVFKVPEFKNATNDKFFLCIFQTDPRFDLDKTRAFLEGLKPEGVFEVEQDETTKVYD
ncbi:MAG: DUF3341 domain-containing protein [Anaerolineae bacterium]